MRLWHYRFAHTINAQIIQVFKLVDRIKLSNVATSNSNNDPFSSDSDVDDREKSEPDMDTHITPTPTLPIKIMKSIKDFYDICIKNKHIKIIKYKAITPIIQKLEKIYTNL